MPLLALNPLLIEPVVRAALAQGLDRTQAAPDRPRPSRAADGLAIRAATSARPERIFATYAHVKGGAALDGRKRA